MCGITGWFSPAVVSQHESQRLKQMLQAISHRGPDGQGILTQDHAAFGHTRLAIIDIAGGGQPMCSQDGKVVITFNGEIYNYVEIRRRLIARGRQFKSQSDTEVILQLYQEEGWQGFVRLRGMYAFAIWDGNTKTGLLVRDPLGIKPLFLKHEDDGGISFGSEAKAILAGNGGQAMLDESSLHLLMNFRYLPGDSSLFRNISQLAPGQILVWEPHRSARQYSIPTGPVETHVTTLDAIRESVALHFTSDVEVGVYLSGGLDSAMIAALGKASGHTGLRTFTLDIGDDPNEAENAAATANHLGITNLRENGLQAPAGALPRLVWHLEKPKINAFQGSRLAKLASKHVKVALSGLGGDEIFLGYNAHRILHLAGETYRLLPDFATNTVGTLGAGLATLLPGPMWSEGERALRMFAALGNWPRVYGLLRNVWDSPKLRRMIYGPRMLDARLPDAFTTLEMLWPNNTDPVSAMATFEWRQKLVNDLLWQEDRVSMAEGLEVRVPFVDTVLAAEIRSLNRHRLMPNGRPKGYLRDIAREILPKEIIDRRKSGFQVDAPAFVTKYLFGPYRALLDEDKTRAIGLFNPEFIKQIKKYGARKCLRWHYFMLYLIIMTHLWIEIFEQRKWPQKK